MDRNSLAIYLKIQSVELDNRFLMSLTEEQRKLYDQVHVLHLAKILNSNGNTDDAKDILNKYYNSVKDDTEMDTSSTGKVIRYIFINTVSSVGYGGGQITVIAKDIDEAHELLLDSSIAYKEDRYPKDNWERVNIEINNDKSYIISENSYIE